jgi:hypothetical protein
MVANCSGMQVFTDDVDDGRPTEKTMDDKNHINYLNPAKAKPRHTSSFYEALKVVIANPAISSCAYFGFGDFQVIEIMAKEQVRRAFALQLSLQDSFPLSVHCDEFYDPSYWGAAISYFTEGLSSKADLLINDYPPTDVVERLLSDGRRTTSVVITSTPQNFYGTIRQEGVGFQVFEL